MLWEVWREWKENACSYRGENERSGGTYLCYNGKGKGGNYAPYRLRWRLVLKVGSGKRESNRDQELVLIAFLQHLGRGNYTSRDQLPSRLFEKEAQYTPVVFLTI